jgi:hemerythrin-like domain-containing protein
MIRPIQVGNVRSLTKEFRKLRRLCRQVDRRLRRWEEREQIQILREDLSDLYVNLDLQKTAFLTKLKKGEDLDNGKLFSWALERYDGRLSEGIPNE